jgi:hypothetical protein
VDVAWQADLAPALDEGEQAVDAGTVAAYAVAVDLVVVNDQAPRRVAYPESDGVPLVAWMAGHPAPIGVLSIHRHQVFGARENEDV